MNVPSDLLRILVVDDDPDTAESTVAVLRLQGFRAWAAFRANTAKIEAEVHQPNVVLLDIGLPGTNGYELAKELCRILGTKPLLVAISGYCQPQDRQRAADEGFDHFFAKPVEPAELIEVLHRHASESECRRESLQEFNDSYVNEKSRSRAMR